MKKWMLLLLVGFFLAYPVFLMQVSGRSGEEGSRLSPGAALADRGAEINSPWGTNQVTTAWARRYNGPGNGYDGAGAIAVDSQGNVYVTGTSWGKGEYTYATLKYSPSGQLLWARRYNGPGSGIWGDQARAIALDSQGNVYVTGNSAGSATGYDYATLKYSPSGQLLWARRYNGPGNGSDEARSIALDSQGNVYVTGISGADIYASGDYATLKYSPSGQLLWERRYDGPANMTGEAQAIAVDTEGNAYITGTSGQSFNDSEFATLKYSPSGHLLWARRYGGPAGYGNEPLAIAVDGQGNVYVTGTSGGSSTWRDYATLKYSPSGQLLWARRYNGPGNHGDIARAIALDSQGNVYVTGTS